MTLRFLRLFRAFCDLEAGRDSEVVVLREAVQQLTTEKLLLQDRLESAQNERAELWAMTRECVNAERAAYQSHINVQWQKQGHGIPYPDAPHIPAGSIPAADPTPIPRRELPSETQARLTREFLKTYQQTA